jgi:molecular chaperone IbpA
MFTTLQSLNKTFDPFSIGFDRVLDDIREITETAAKNVSKYPPYNIKKVNDKKWVIEMAVAGFAKSDIELSLDGNKLTVSGAAQEDDAEPFEGYAFKGIANRDFSHTFKIADKVEIGNAEMVNGMLKIWLESLSQTQDNIKKIAIK